MLTIENIKKKYGDIEVLKGLDLEISSGEVLSIIGHSGCGKTTLLRLIAGLEKPDEGKIFSDGIEISSPAKIVEPYKRKLSMIFQELALWPHMTVREHIEFVLKNKRTSGNGFNNDTNMVLKDVSLNGYNKRYPHELSGGEKQRLAIARALASKPNYLLMDEPFNNLDIILKEELQSIIGELKNNFKMGIIYVTHNPKEIASIADKCIVINQGEIEQKGSLEELKASPKTKFVELFLKEL